MPEPKTKTFTPDEARALVQDALTACESCCLDDAADKDVVEATLMESLFPLDCGGEIKKARRRQKRAHS